MRAALGGQVWRGAERFGRIAQCAVALTSACLESTPSNKYRYVSFGLAAGADYAQVPPLACVICNHHAGTVVFVCRRLLWMGACLGGSGGPRLQGLRRVASLSPLSRRKRRRRKRTGARVT